MGSGGKENGGYLDESCYYILKMDGRTRYFHKSTMLKNSSKILCFFPGKFGAYVVSFHSQI